MVCSRRRMAGSAQAAAAILCAFLLLAVGAFISRHKRRLLALTGAPESGSILEE